MADMKLDSSRATPWIKNVREEVASVNMTLDKVRTVCSTFPGEGDTVFKMIESTGNFLEETWNVATKAYRDAWEKVEGGLSAVGKAGEVIGDLFDAFKASNNR